MAASVAFTRLGSLSFTVRATPQEPERAVRKDAVTGVANGIRLSLTKKQVEDLPPAD